MHVDLTHLMSVIPCYILYTGFFYYYIIFNLCSPSGAGCFRGVRAAHGGAELPGGAVGQLRSLVDAGSAAENRPTHHGLCVCAGSQWRRQKETFLKRSRPNAMKMIII